MAERLVHKERRNAEWALALVQKLQGQGGRAAELLADIRKLPSHIQTSGLAQTLLFYGKNQENLAREFAQHVLGTADIAAAIRELVADATKFRFKTHEALNAAQWLKRVAEVELKESDGSQRKENSGAG